MTLVQIDERGIPTSPYSVEHMILLFTAVNLHVLLQLQRPDVRKCDVDPVMEGLSEALPASRSVHRTGYFHDNRINIR